MTTGDRRETGPAIAGGPANSEPLAPPGTSYWPVIHGCAGVGIV
jgi:hypothetical protein